MRRRVPRFVTRSEIVTKPANEAKQALTCENWAHRSQKCEFLGVLIVVGFSSCSKPSKSEENKRFSGQETCPT